ncbi:FeoA domain-containing protein [Candidatus Aerophobetes bacterium]|nr:FeoA domain-containing protein [Candidatus Aerophobetes bacterium]
MFKESDILKVVKEDILRILSERRRKVPLKLIKAEIGVSHPFISKGVKDLRKENLVCIGGDLISLTKDGEDKAKDILRKHLVLENYFKRTINETEAEAHKKAHILEHYISEEVVKNIKKISTFKEKEISLRELDLHKESLIIDITIPDNELFERVVSMGIFPGEKIRLTNKIPGGIIVKIKNKKFALDKGIAKEIKVLKYEKS